MKELFVMFLEVFRRYKKTPPILQKKINASFFEPLLAHYQTALEHQPPQHHQHGLELAFFCDQLITAAADKYASFP